MKEKIRIQIRQKTLKQIKKFKISEEEIKNLTIEAIKVIIKKSKIGNINLTKLEWFENFYRIRKWKFRIIFQYSKETNGIIIVHIGTIIKFSKRDDKTYKNL